MPKFANGECALVDAPKEHCTPAAHPYLGTIVRVLEFTGLHPRQPTTFTDWYRVETEDDRKMSVREPYLHKLPGEYTPGDMRVIEELMNKKRNEVTCE